MHPVQTVILQRIIAVLIAIVAWLSTKSTGPRAPIPLADRYASKKEHFEC
jgi:hypothetical protein